MRQFGEVCNPTTAVVSLHAYRTAFRHTPMWPPPLAQHSIAPDRSESSPKGCSSSFEIGGSNRWQRSRDRACRCSVAVARPVAGCSQTGAPIKSLLARTYEFETRSGRR